MNQPASLPSAANAKQADALSVGSFHAYRTQTIRNLPFWSPCLVWIQAGSKQMTTQDQALLGNANDLVLISAGVRCHLENRPDTVAGEYRALAFELTADDLEALHKSLGLELALGICERIAVRQPTGSLQNALEGLQQALDSHAHPAIARHRLREVLMQWVLLEPGIWPLLLPKAGSTTLLVQSLVARDPHGDWTLAKLARLLNRSVATLGRQLKDEQTGLRAILDDVRLVRAFNLLQTTHASVDQVAQDCGYQSSARFSERFRCYFGLTPAQLRRTRQKSIRRTN